MVYSSDLRIQSIQEESFGKDPDNSDIGPFFWYYSSDWDVTDTNENFSAGTRKNPYEISPDFIKQSKELSVYGYRFNVYVTHFVEKTPSEKKNAENQTRNYIS